MRKDALGKTTAACVPKVLQQNLAGNMTTPADDKNLPYDSHALPIVELPPLIPPALDKGVTVTLCDKGKGELCLQTKTPLASCCEAREMYRLEKKAQADRHFCLNSKMLLQVTT